MGRKCIICGIKSTKHQKISLHTFPKDVVQRIKWLNVCQIDETKINSDTVICRNHFNEEDFLYRAADNKLILKRNAVPFIVKLCKCQKRLYQEVTDFTNNASNSTMNIKKEIKIELNVGFEYMDNNKTSDSITSVTTAEENNNKYVIFVMTEKSEYFDNNKTSDDAVVIQNNIVENNISPETIEGETSGSTPHLRYVGDITPAHLATPKIAKKALNLAVKKIVQQKKKIKALQQSSYRFKKKLKSLKDLVQQLRKRDLITENAAKVLLVFLNNF